MKKVYLLVLASFIFSLVSFGQFVENRGQVFDEGGKFREDVHFVAQFSGVNLYFTNHGVVHHYRKITPSKYNQIKAGKIPNPYTDEEWEKIELEGSKSGGEKNEIFQDKGKQYRVDVTFPNANLDNPIGEDKQLREDQYFLPQKSEGIQRVKHFGKIRYKEAYPGIDLIFYEKEGGLKYDFEVSANADVEQIKILYKGHQKISLDDEGNAIVKVLPGRIMEHAPVSFQEDSKVKSHFKLSNDTILIVLGKYNKNRPITIDPALTWSTYFHDGTTSSLFTSSRPAWDASGNMYQAVNTYNRTTYPLVNPGGSAYYNITPGSSGTQLIIQKYNTSRQIVWATYYPGDRSSQCSFSNQCIAIDNSNNLYVVGSVGISGTTSFPLFNPGGGAYYETGVGNGRGFILKFSSAGQRLWATMFCTSTIAGSSSGMDLKGIAINSNNKLIITGDTYTGASGSWQPIPLANPGGSYYYRSTAPESEVPTLHRFSATGVLEWGTYISQGVADTYNAGQCVAVDPSDNIFIGGRAGQEWGAGSASPYTLVNPGGGAYQDGYNTNTNNGRKFSAFKFLANGSLYWNTLYGGVSSANSVIWQDYRDVVVNSAGDVFFIGRSNCTDFPTFNPGGGAYMKTTLSSGSTAVYDGIITKFSNNGVRRWATYCGGNGSSDGTDFWGVAIDGSDNITIGGVSRTTNTFPVLSQAGSYNQASQTDTYGAIITQFNSSGVQQWATYYGDGTWVSSGGFGGDGAGKYVMFGTAASIPTVNPGGGAYYQSAHELTATRTDFIAEFSSCIAETNTTSTTAICENATKALTSSGAGTGTWSVQSGGGSITGTTYTPANISSATSVTIRYTDGCGTTSDRVFTVNPLPNTPSTPTGPSPVCSGVATTGYGVTAVSGATSYQWSYSGTGTVTPTGSPSGITATLNATTAGNLTVRAVNACGASAYSSPLAITIATTPAQPGVITGNTNICSSSQTYSVTNVSGVTYAWTYSGGGTPSGTTNSTTFTPTSSGTLSVTASNACGTSAARTLAITVASAAPSQPSVITGSTPICSSSQTYSVTNVAGVTYAWSYSGGGTPSGTTNSTTFTPISSGTLSVTATNACGTSTPRTLAIVVDASAPAQPSTITGNTDICSSSQTYSVTNVAGVTYAWSYSGGGTPSGTTNSTTFTPTSSGTLSVTASNACGTSAARTLAITVSSVAPSQPSAITGTTPVCSGSSQTYSVTNVAGVTYAWSYSGTGTPSGTTNSTTFSPTSSGTLSVTASNACGTSTPRTLAIVVDASAPAQPSVITGNDTLCSSGQTYSVTNVAGVTYAWSYSGTGTPTGTTNSTTFTPTTSGTLSVTASNSCGTSAARTLAITVYSGAPATPGAITGTSNFCRGTSQSYSIGAVANATSYTWSYSGAPSVSSTTTSVTFTPLTSGVLSVTATNACGTSAARNLSLTVDTTYPVNIISSGFDMCVGDARTLVGSPVGGTFSVLSGGAFGSVTGNTLNANAVGTVQIRYRITNACGNMDDTQSINIVSTSAATITSPTTAMCIDELRGLTGTPTGGSFSIIGGPGYIGLNDTLTANASGTVQVEYQYISPCGITADTVSITINPEPIVTITSANTDMCIGGTRALTGTPGAGTWAVLSGPGSITGSTLTATGAGTIQIEYTASALGCPGSTTQTITVLGSSDATWTNPGNICESAGLVDLTTYLPGTSTPGGVWSGSPNVSSGGILNTAGLGGTTINIKYKVGPTPCADSLTLPVTISIAPDATWSIPSTICESQQFDLDTLLDPSATTGGTWSGPGVTGSIFDPYGLSGPVTIKYVVSNANCSDSLSQTVNNILIAPTAPTVTLSSDTICDGSGVTITASGSGSNVAYNVWDSPTGGTFLGQTPLTVYPTANTTYYVEAYGANLCPQVGARTSASVVVDILAPVSLGGDQAICYGTSINLSVPNNASYTYLWSDGSTTNTFSSTPSADETVWVSVTNNIGCEVTDTIEVTVNGLVPVEANDDSTIVVSERLDTIDVQANDGQVGAIIILNAPLNGTATVNANGEIEYKSNAGYTGEDMLSYEICDAFCSGICDTAYVSIQIDHNVFDDPDNGNIGAWGVTPNGDGINDVLVIDGLFEYPDNEITIYNRWGDEVYHAKPYNHDWDGQEPIKLVNGTYFFILDIEGKSETFKGFIHLQK